MLGTGDCPDQALRKKFAVRISISAVLNNELRRFATEQSVVFDVPEVPNSKTAKQLTESKKQIDTGEYHKFESNKEALDFLAKELK